MINPNPAFNSVQFEYPTIKCGKNLEIIMPVNAWGCEFGDDVRVGPFTEIQSGVIIGSRVKISSHVFICTGVTIGDDVFVGHSVAFCNDRYPQSSVDGKLKGSTDWLLEEVKVGNFVSIGTGAVILPGITIGEHAMIGAGSVVTGNVREREVVVGNPARFVRFIR